MWDGNRHVVMMALGTTKVYGYTNIYQCGLIMYSLMLLQFGYRAPRHEGYHPPPTPPLIGIRHPIVPFSENFIRTVYSYLISSPNQRPSPLTALAAVEESIERLASDMAHYREEFGELPGRDSNYAGKLIYDVNLEGLAFKLMSQEG